MKLIKMIDVLTQVILVVGTLATLATNSNPWGILLLLGFWQMLASVITITAKARYYNLRLVHFGLAVLVLSLMARNMIDLESVLVPAIALASLFLVLTVLSLIPAIETGKGFLPHTSF